ncbi:major larval glue protein [Diplodia corticola]|uniref:Major larval glue protein n=1 Tax=Diplodia corticola TaxID=236234 RepID=A0A1J9S2Q2_9PEZI|nr:major larval glue protein [Diplodia corticola]OJD33917.1 major larval glue protein [Diplodia corticola]
MKSFLAVIIAAAAAPALAASNASTTVMVTPCASSTASVNDIVTRTPVMMASQSTPCPTLSIVKTNGTTITMSHDGSGSGSGSGSSATTTPASYTGAAVANNAGLSGAVAAAFGLAAFIL